MMIITIVMIIMVLMMNLITEMKYSHHNDSAYHLTKFVYLLLKKQRKQVSNPKNHY